MATTAVKELRILLVDDEASVLDHTVAILNSLGYRKIETADNGETALVKLASKTTPFDLIICDLNMPKMNGVEFIRLAKDGAFDGGVILLTGEGRRVLETARKLVAAQNHNILGVLPKPLRPDLLEDLLNSFKPPIEERRPFIPQDPITEAELRACIDREGDELLLVYQPKIHVQSGEVAGVETLARWNHSDRGILGPGAFIPLAEKTGLIDALSHQIYRKAVQQTSSWLAAGIYLKTSINFSIGSFADPDFVNFLVAATEDAGLDPRQLILEVTETQVMTDALDYMEVMMQIRMKNFGLSIDNFGTGNASKAQLEDIPFTELKIDGGYVRGAVTEEHARAILKTSINFGRNLDMETVADGVETQKEWDLVEELGIDYVQGFFCAKPMPNKELLLFLDSWHPPPRRIRT
ncbi:MAG: EAL domain-containing response regulator [Proteobacteria bacterium]|nr:EAL domain-containing response regulator [Pseudomonadota bacterium]MCH8265514.1 EAL domain-containing response regulator [Pseudomonadota bacterium]